VVVVVVCSMCGLRLDPVAAACMWYLLMHVHGGSMVCALPAWVDGTPALRFCRLCCKLGWCTLAHCRSPLSEPLVGSHAVTSPTIYTYLYGACCITSIYIVVCLAAGLGLSGGSDCTLLVPSTFDPSMLPGCLYCLCPN
jgi:hypothetical protein